MQRVVVTGLGTCTSYGIGVDLLWENLLSGNTILKEVPSKWKTNPESKILYSPLPKFEYNKLGFSRAELMQYEPVTLNALLSVEEAIKHADIPYTKLNDKLNRYQIENLDTSRIGAFGGTGIGGIDTLLQSTLKLIEVQKGKSIRLDALSVAKTMPYNIAASIGIKLRLHKNINSYSYACATGSVILGKAFEQIKNNNIDMAIVSSSEYTDQDIGLLYNGFLYGNTITREENAEIANIPFDKQRSGFLFSEGGSGTLIVESLEHAQKRGANILAEIVGFSETFDGFNMVSPDPSGLYIEEMLNTLLNDTQIKAEEIDYINTHGTGTIKNDKIEAMVLEKIFNKDVAINSTKSLLGHTISASGTIEAITTILSIKNRVIHENNGLKEPISDLNFVTEKTNLDIKYAISQSFAFGGHNSSLLFKKYED